MKRLITFIILIILGLTLNLYSMPLRHGSKKFKNPEGYGGFTMGLYYNSMNSLNARLKGTGYGTVDSTFTTIGGMGYGLADNRIMLGGSGFLLMDNQSESSSSKNKVKGGYGFFEMGYGIIKTKNYGLFPVLGIGGGTTKIKLNSKYSGSPDFNDILNDPKRNAEIKNSSFALKLALRNHISFKVREKIEDGKRQIFKMGCNLNIGVIYTFNNSWELDDIEVYNSPKLPKEKYYASITILFGGSEKSLNNGDNNK